MPDQHPPDLDECSSQLVDEVSTSRDFGNRQVDPEEVAARSTRPSLAGDRLGAIEEMELSARSTEFAERVRGWIEEKLDKIRDIRRTNQELEKRIESAKGQLGR